MLRSPSHLPPTLFKLSQILCGVNANTRSLGQNVKSFLWSMMEQVLFMVEPLKTYHSQENPFWDSFDPIQKGFYIRLFVWKSVYFYGQRTLLDQESNLCSKLNVAKGLCAELQTASPVPSRQGMWVFCAASLVFLLSGKAAETGEARSHPTLLTQPWHMLTASLGFFPPCS